MVTENGIQSDGNQSFLRAARVGNLEKVLEHLKNGIDINTSNANGLNALHLASKDGHIALVKELLARGANVDAATKKGNTAMHIASLAGQEEVVKLLIQHSASVNVQSQNGFSPLYMAAQENHDSVVRLLLSNGANQSLATEDGFTPLAVAMQQGHDKVVAVLLESDTRGKVRLPALHIAAKKDDVKAATLLLENDHNPDVTSKSNFTPLHIASHYGNEAIANLLIQKGADVNFAAKHNISPLHVAAKWGKANMVSLLLEKGANIEAKTRDGLTALHCAARSGHEQVVDMLLERGAPISSKTKNGLAALHMAAQGEHVDAARILLYHRAPVDEVTVDYLTALHVACHCGHVRVAKLLLDRNADANARALNGFTPLHIACKKNRIKVVELLLKHGANISATTESGLTPLHVSSFMGCMNIVIYLLQHDASPDVPTVRGETALHLAARANQTDIIRILLRNGAQVDARAREQQTPLHIASRLGNVDIVMLLLQHGAQVDAVTKDMYTALHIAAKEGQEEVAAVLLENGAQIDAKTKKNFTPLHLTAKYGHIKVAELLLNKNAPIDAQGKNGVTSLHVASHYDNQNVALLLLDRGASPHATAKNGHTPLHIAARKNQMEIATTLLEYGASANAESKAGFSPLHLSAQEGHTDLTSLLLEHKANPNHQARNGLTSMHLCAQEDKVNVAQILSKHGADLEAVTKNLYTPLHISSHFGQANMVRYLLQEGVQVNTATTLGYTALHQAAQQGHCHIVHLLLEHNADPNATTQSGQTAYNIAQKLGYISVMDSLKSVTTTDAPMQASFTDEKYRVVAPEAMHETFMSDSEEEGGEDTNLSDHPYRYLTVDEMKSLGDDSLPIDVTRDERMDSNKMITSTDSANMHIHEDSISPAKTKLQYGKYDKKVDNVFVDRVAPQIGKLSWKNFLVSFLVDARGGAMRGCRHSGVRIIVPPRSLSQPTRVTCRYVKPQRTLHPPPLMEGEALASRVLELGPVNGKFLGPVVMEVPHFASLRGKEREIVILRSDNGETWREHTIDNSEEIVQDVLGQCFEPEEISQMDELGGGRICRFVTYDFPQYFAVISRIRQEVHAIGPEGGMVSSTVVPQVQAVFPQGALTKKIKVGLQAQPIDPDLTAKLLGRGVAVSPVVTVEPRRRKFHKAITLSMPAPRAHSQGMINQYSGSAPTLRLLCSITGGTTRAQWEDVTGSTPLTFVNDCVSFTTTVSARFWLMDCRNIADATKMATELYKEAIHVPFMAKFVVFAKRTDPLEARLRVFCMTDDREDKTLEHQEHYTEVAKSRDVEVLEDKVQFIELAGNLVPITKSGEQLKLSFKAFRENRLPFPVRVKDQHADTVGRALFMREPKIAKGEPPQQPICILNIVLPEDIIPEQLTVLDEEQERTLNLLMSRHSYSYVSDLRIVDISNLLGEDWVRLAPEIGVSQTDIDVIVEQNPASTAKQAQAMLTLFQSRPNSDINILEHGLRVIHRDDIVNQCIKTTILSKTTTTTTTTKRIPGYSVVSTKTTSLDMGGADDEPDLMKDSESVEELRQEDVRHELKYSVEEKIVEKSESEEEEESAQRTVAERRQQIQKRLSTEKSVPSTQKKEIQEEIVEIKRRSLIEETKSKHEEEILMQKPVDNSYKSGPGLPEPVVKLKTSTSRDGSGVSKLEFDQELQDKFKTTLKDVDQYEHVSAFSSQEKQEVYDIGSDLLEKVAERPTEKTLPAQFTSEESTESTTTSNGESVVAPKSTIQTITTGDAAFTIRTDTKMDSRMSSKESRDSRDEEFKVLKKEALSSVDDDLMAKLSAQKDRVESTTVTQSFLEEESKVIKSLKTESVEEKDFSRSLSSFETESRSFERAVKEEVHEEVVPEIKQLDEVIQQEQVKVERKLEEKFDEITKGSQLITPAAAKKLISSGILPSGSGTFDDLHEDEVYGKKEQLLEDEPEPENLMEEPVVVPTTTTVAHTHTSVESSAPSVPKPTPRLSKSYTNDTNSSLTQEDVESAPSVEHETSSQSSSQETSGSFPRRGVWEIPEDAPVPRPRHSISKPGEKSLETDTSSIRSERQPESLPPFDSLKQQDSLPYDDRLEDESFPMSESESETNRTRDSVSVSLKGEFVEHEISSADSHKATDDETDDAGAAFYIGDKSSNIITKTSSDKRNEFAFDNAGYEVSGDDTRGELEIYDEKALETANEGELAQHLVQKPVDDEKTEAQEVVRRMEEHDKSETEKTEKRPPTSLELDEPVVSRRPVVIHSPVEKVIQLEKSQEIVSAPVAKATAVEVQALRTQKEQEREVEQAFEEIKDSLDAVQEELIEVVKDGKLIKQSPSEFEITFVPHEQSLPSHPEEAPDQPLSIIRIQAPSEDTSSADESTNKADVIKRRATSTTPTSNRWSVTDVESSSGESNYQSAVDPSSRSRPQSSSEFDTAMSQTPVPGSASTDYQSAISTLHTGDMKSFDSESSGNLASIEASEASETLVPSQMEECEADIAPEDLEDAELVHDDSEKSGGSLEEKDPNVILLESGLEPLSQLKRSQEMIFTETSAKSDSTEDLLKRDFKTADETQFGSLEDTRILASSLEDGSLLSVSLSSASNLETVMENMDGSEVVGNLIGSYDSGKVYLSRTEDPPTPTETKAEPSEEQSAKKRGHRRNESTSVNPASLLQTAGDSFDSSELDDEMIVHEDQPHSEPFIQAMQQKGGVAPSGAADSGSDSDYDRYESEYSRSFRAPAATTRSKKEKKLDEGLPVQDVAINRSRSPSFSMIETIVEDVHAESDAEQAPVVTDRRPSSINAANIPDIKVTEEVVEEDEVVKLRQEIEERTTFAQQVEYKMTEEEYQEIIEQKYRAQETGRYGYDDEDFDDPNKPESPGSDSFEMLEQPDISDEFVIVEEVAKEAHEFDPEGKSMGIKRVKLEKKGDEDVERLYLVKSAPDRTDAATFVAHRQGDEPFDFEESPPIAQEGEAREVGNGYPLEGSKRWVEMQLNDPNNLRYPYELQGGVLEDIKEEDTDFEVGSSRISSFKDSFSSTPDYDLIARKLHSRENDNISMSSLQEFESLEQVISLENRKQAQSSAESLSNGSYPKRSGPSKPGDDVSLSSLREFEALENASLEAVLLEIKAKEEAALLLSRSDESGRSDSSNGKRVGTTQGSPKVTTVTTTTVVRTAQVTQVVSSARDEDDSSLNVMEVSTDSLEGGARKDSAHHASTDSLERNNTNADVMSSSIDSIDVQGRSGTGGNGGGTTKSTSRSDSIEQGLNDVRKSESVDSIELQQAIARHQSRIDRDSLEEVGGFHTTTVTSGGRVTLTRTTVTTTGGMQKEFSSDSITSQASNEPLLTSTESITSSTATNATFTNDMNSQMSGSMTSCDSTTLIDYNVPPNAELGQSSSNYLLFDERELGQLRYEYDLAEDAGFGDEKESDKEKLQSKTTEKED